MQIISYKLEANLTFDEASVEEFLSLCEDAVKHITDDEHIRFKLTSAVHELLVNALEHGYKKSAGKVCISIFREQNNIIFEVSDEGQGLNPACINLNKAIQSIDEASNRGWGLIITNKLFENMKILPNYPKGTKITITIPL